MNIYLNEINLCDTAFIEELGNLLESTSTLSGKLVLLGDFNVHLDSNTEPESRQLTSLLESFGLVQHVKDATHIKGHLLDLVVSRETDDLVQSCEVGDFISDHNSILVSLNSSKPHPKKKYTTFRKIKSVVPESFSSDISSSDLTKQLPSNVDEMVSCYNRVLKELMDKHAPLKSRAIADRTSEPWMNEDIQRTKQLRRRHEKL